VIGQLVASLAGIERQIDVLREVYGLRRQELAGDAVTLKIDTKGQTHAIRVLPVIPCFKLKSPILPLSIKRIATSSSIYTSCYSLFGNRLLNSSEPPNLAILIRER